MAATSGDAGEEPEDQEPEEGATLFVKNINFDTTDEALREVSGARLVCRTVQLFYLPVVLRMSVTLRNVSS